MTIGRQMHTGKMICDKKDWHWSVQPQAKKCERLLANPTLGNRICTTSYSRVWDNETQFKALVMTTRMSTYFSNQETC